MPDLEQYQPGTKIDGLQRLRNVLEGRGLEYFYSVPAPAEDADENERFAYSAMLTQLKSNSDQHIADVLNETLYMREFFVHRVVVFNEQTQEDVETLRSVIVDRDGMTYSAVSDGAIDGFATILELFGPSSKWPTDGLPIQFKQVNTRRGRRTFNMVVVNENAEKPKSKGRR